MVLVSPISDINIDINDTDCGTANPPDSDLNHVYHRRNLQLPCAKTGFRTVFNLLPIIILAHTGTHTSVKLSIALKRNRNECLVTELELRFNNGRIEFVITGFCKQCLVLAG